MQHSFDIEIAEKYGVSEAILLQHLWFWIEKNKANEVNFYDGTYWTYNSAKAFVKLFPYMTQRQIQNALKRLKEKGIIKTGNYNKSSYDRTLWYAFTELGKSIMQKCKMENTNLSNGLHKNVTPIPDINTNINTDNNTNINNKEERKKETNYDKIINSMVEDEEVKNSIYEFIKMRKLIKKPMTDRAVTMLINKLEKLSSDKDIQIKILEQSILKNWTDIYPYKEENNYAGYQGNVKTDVSKYDR